MLASDHRDITFSHLRARIEHGLRATAWEMWQAHGPGTTREVSARGGMDLLTFRPRTTELYQAGWLELVPGEHPPGEGVYRARSMDEIEAAWQEHGMGVMGQQQLL